jgi:hypothetical protein
MLPTMRARIGSVESFGRAARLLEDAFFLAQDSVLIERLRAMQKMQESKDALAAVSGISNDAILSRLVELDVRPETLAALAAVPLIEVAWADGGIDPEEREAVLSHANGQGIRPGSIEHELLECWLTHRPESTLFEAWRAYLSGLCDRLNENERELLKEELLHATKATAQASGGFLGIGSISSSEREMLDRLAASFCCCGDWTES